MEYRRSWSSSTVELENSVADLASRLSMDWMISSVVLLSMMLQLIMAFGGALRYRSGSWVLQLLLWLGYMSADGVAIYALGTMAQSETRAMFGLWAPILLLHLGGPDTITAYSTQDNDLWLRHLLAMSYQISVAAYIVYLSQLGGYLLAAALLLLTLGISKYGERTMALKFSSSSHIVSSSDPMNAFMSDEGRECNYLVMGLNHWRSREWVSIHNVWESEGKRLTENYLLCLSHALFKMVKRRCVNLYLQERNYRATRKFLFEEKLSHISRDKIFAVTEMEMKFLYDLLFSKSSGTAFSKLGTAIRLVNIFLLGVTEFLIYSELQRSRRVAEEEVVYKQRVVAFVLLSVALVLEVVQLCRIWASDWTIVWLICKRIQHRSNGQTGLDLYMPAAMLIQIVLRISNCLRKLFRGKYWKDQIPHYSLIRTCSHLSPSFWKLAQSLRLTAFVIAWYTNTEPLGDYLKEFILDKIKERCLTQEEEEEALEEYDVERYRERLAKYNSILDEHHSQDLSWASNHGHEFLILRWHIATSICERKYSEGGDQKEDTVLMKNVEVSRKLSGYCAHLLVSTPNLLPLHPQGANLRHMDVHDTLFNLGVDRLESYGSSGNNNLLKDGAKLARELQDKPEEQRWTVISDYWGGLIIFYAMKNKASIHIKRLAVGGELLTLLWAILGHMGVGDQWETSGV